MTAKNVGCSRLHSEAGCPEPALTTKFQNHCNMMFANDLSAVTLQHVLLPISVT